MDTPPATDIATIVSGEIVAGRKDTSLAGITAAWLWTYRESAHTRAAYQRDITAWVHWCAERDLDVLAVERRDVDAYAAFLANTPNPHTGRPLAPASLARRLSAIASWYGYLLDAKQVTANPCVRVRRPKIDKDMTTTVGMSAIEAIALRSVAGSDTRLSSACGVALAAFLLDLGARVSEVCRADIADLGHDSGHRTVRLRMKGGKSRIRAVPPALNTALAAYLGDRTEGTIFLNRDGQRINRDEVAGFVTRCARAAGLAGWEKITPHSFRHAWATIARERGASLEERQYALGHADPRTTQRYDRARASLDRDPSYLVAAATSG